MLAVLGGSIAGVVWFQYRIGPIPALGSLLTDPYCALPSRMRINLAGSGGCRLLQTQPFEAFLVRMKVGVAVGCVLTSPVWLYQLWAFVTPGLRVGERKFTRIFVGFAVVLFACGATLAYLIVPLALRALVNFGGDQFISALAGNDYVSFVLALLIIFGISFELPLLVVMLNRVGVLPYTKLRKWRRGMIFALVVFAALVTPGSDPFSMLGLAGALALLLEVAVQLSRLHDRKIVRDAADDAADRPAPSEDEVDRFNRQLAAMRADPMVEAQRASNRQFPGGQQDADI
jgi:sec-independent protein translocase protein TatC